MDSGGTAFEQKLKRMTTEPVEGLVARMAVPTIVIMLISALYNMADTYFVSGLGTSATAAVGVSFSLMAVIQAIGFFFGHGSGNYISRSLGAGRTGDASRMAMTGFASSLAAGALVAAGGLLFLEDFAISLGSTPTILPHAKEYLVFILLGAPWMVGSLMLNNLLRFQGSAAYGMAGMTGGAVLNVALDPLFIYTFELGVAGASLATMASQFVGFCLLLAGCAKGGNIAVRFAHFSPQPWHFREIFRGGFPSLCRQGLLAVSTVFLNHAAREFGDAAIAALSIVRRVYWVAGSALIGWGQGFQPVCGFNYGAGLYARVRRAFWFCFKSSFWVLLAFSVLGIVFAGEIIARFRRDDPDVIRIGALALRMQCLVMPLIGWAILHNMMLQTIGRAGPATLLAMARQGLFLLPALFILKPWLGVLGIQLAQPIADFATVILAAPLGLNALRDMAAREKAGGAESGPVPVDSAVEDI